MVININLNFFKKSKPTNQIINLSTEQKEDFFKCLTKYKFTMRKTKHKLIDYAKMFINNQMSYELYFDLREYNRKIEYNYDNYHIFKTNQISIAGRPYVIFYIDDFVSITKVAIADKVIGLDETKFIIKHNDVYIYTDYYDNVTEFNGYQLFYSINEYSNSDMSVIKYIKCIDFLLCKNGLVYIKNSYRCNKALKTEIIGSAFNIKNKSVFNKFKLKTSDITKKN